MKELIYKKQKELEPNTTNRCFNCKQMLHYGTIPCPENKVGCMVLHYGYVCPNCGSIYQ